MEHNQGTGIRLLQSLYLEAGRRAMQGNRPQEAEELLIAGLNEGGVEGDPGAQAEPWRLLLQLYMRHAQWPEAERAAREALAILAPAWTAESPDVVDLIASLAEAFRQQKKFAQARPLLEFTLAFNERRVGPDHLELVPTLRMLSDICLAQKDAAGAESFAKRALGIQERVLGPYHDEVAQAVRHVADLCEIGGKLSEAEVHLQRVLEIRQKAFGEAAPAVAEGHEALATHYSMRELWGQAESQFRRALEIREKALGPTHPAVIATLEDLANLCSASGNETMADQIRERARSLKPQKKAKKKD